MSEQNALDSVLEIRDAQLQVDLLSIFFAIKRVFPEQTLACIARAFFVGGKWVQPDMPHWAIEAAISDNRVPESRHGEFMRYCAIIYDEPAETAMEGADLLKDFLGVDEAPPSVETPQLVPEPEKPPTKKKAAPSAEVKPKAGKSKPKARELEEKVLTLTGKHMDDALKALRDGRRVSSLAAGASIVMLTCRLDKERTLYVSVVNGSRTDPAVKPFIDARVEHDVEANVLIAFDVAYEFPESYDVDLKDSRYRVRVEKDK